MAFSYRANAIAWLRASIADDRNSGARECEHKNFSTLSYGMDVKRFQLFFESDKYLLPILAAASGGKVFANFRTISSYTSFCVVQTVRIVQKSSTMCG